MSLHKSYQRYLLLTTGVVFAGIMAYKIKRYLQRYLNFCWKRKCNIYVCSNLQQWEEKEEEFLACCKKSKVIGLDCEWVSSPKGQRPVALLQLATAHDICLLIRLCCMKPDSLPKNLVELLQDGSILKVGVGIWDDVKKLTKNYGVFVRGFVDLRYLINSLQEFQDMQNPSLKLLAHEILGTELIKHKRIRCSNWEAEILEQEQITYAAEDAIVAAQIFEKLLYRKFNKGWLYMCIFTTPILELENLSNIFCAGFIDKPYKCAGSPVHVTKTSQLLLSNCPSLSKRKESSRGYSIRQKPLYENCWLHAPDGEPLCVCDSKKAQWYLEKGLGEMVSDDPLVVRLTFEPSGRPILDNKYYTHEKENCCVVCGKTESLIKKVVVPHEYRRCFPGLMKKHLSHDVVLLCVVCHRQSNNYDLNLRYQLADECNAPIGSGENVKVKDNPELSKVRSAARALAKSKDKIPQSRQQELKKIIQNYYKVSDVSEDLIQEATNLDTCVFNNDYIPHGLKVVQYMCEHDGLIALETRWRQHFLNNMHPKYLPKLWSVDHNHERLAFQVVHRKFDFDTSILGLTSEQLARAKKNTSGIFIDTCTAKNFDLKGSLGNDVCTGSLVEFED